MDCGRRRLVRRRGRKRANAPIHFDCSPVAIRVPSAERPYPRWLPLNPEGLRPAGGALARGFVQCVSPDRQGVPDLGRPDVCCCAPALPGGRQVKERVLRRRKSVELLSARS